MAHSHVKCGVFPPKNLLKKSASLMALWKAAGPPTNVFSTPPATSSLKGHDDRRGCFLHPTYSYTVLFRVSTSEALSIQATINSNLKHIPNPTALAKSTKDVRGPFSAVLQWLNNFTINFVKCISALNSRSLRHRRGAGWDLEWVRQQGRWFRDLPADRKLDECFSLWWVWLSASSSQLNRKP
ncbi:hypothetical protein B0H14DRAFT_2584296 [Mycena olivaceomarginata]|nr:hypothetical protein B0H14DRAFT_2584296 [Mycena olivaceomarginata]